MKPKYLNHWLRNATAFTMVLLMLATLFVSPAFAASQGPFNAGAGASIPADPGAIAWSTPGNITEPGFPRATAAVPGNGTTEYLRGTGYGFTIPSGSAISGITVVVSRVSSGTSFPIIQDSVLRLVSDAGVSTNRAATGTNWPTTGLTPRTYAGSLTYWGISGWTVEQINDPDFGVELVAVNGHPAQPRTATVDFMQIAIEYTLPGTTTGVNCGAGTPVVVMGESITCVATVTRSAGSNTPTGTVAWTSDGAGTIATSPCTLSGSDGTVTCSVTYTPSAIGDGSHLITATYGGDANFTGSSNNQTVTVNRATPTLSVTNSPVTYTGLAQAAVVEGSVAGLVSNVRYDGSATVPTNAGTYAVTADFAPTDTTNYNNLTGAPAGNFVIEKVTPTLSVTNSPVTYTGSAQAATVEGSVPGVVSNVLYDSSATVPTDAGTYAVTADFTPTDADNYESLTGAAAGDFVIEQATPTLSVTNSPVTYTGSAQAAVVEGSVPGVVSNVLYDGSTTVPADAGTYAVTADFVPTDADNYESLTGASAGNFVIEQATPTLSVTNSPVTYTGSAQAAVVEGSVPGVVSNVLYDGLATVPTDTGTYAVTADFAPTDTTNYTSLTGAAAGNFVIQPAGPYLTLVKTADPITFNGAGVVISYSYELTNTGDVTLDGPFTVTDDKATVTCPATASLAPTESITCTASYTTTLADVLAGSVTNSATGSGFFLTNPVVSEVAQATVTGVARKLYLPIMHR
jgi:hypothetical protein